jgi:hypothetical protein
MSKFHYLKAGALGVLATTLAFAALPAQAQDRGHGRGRSDWSQRGEDRAQSPRQSQDRGSRGNGNGGQARAQDNAQSNARSAEAQVRAQAQTRGETYASQQRNRSYGADARAGWQGRGQGGARAQTQAEAARQAGRPAEQRGWTQRSYGANRQQDYGASNRAEARRDWRQDGGQDRQDARQDYRQGYRAGQQQDWRNDRRDRQTSYAQGYRNGYRSGDRDDHRRWDNRGWRNDSRYDWYRYRAANRSIFSLGRYYAPYRNYSYSRLSIGFRLGNLFYSNRYWIDDPWRYRLPAVYGPYRWIRYYDDALLVDTYSGEVVDVIYDFFW